MRQMIFVAAATAAIAGTAQAQSLAQDLRGAINAGGQACPEVTRYAGIAAVAGTNDVLLAAACTDGSRHVVRANQKTGAMRYVSPCNMAGPKISCDNLTEPGR